MQEAHLKKKEAAILKAREKFVNLRDPQEIKSFSTETMKVRRQSDGIFKVLKENKSKNEKNPSIKNLCLEKLSLKK